MEMGQNLKNALWIMKFSLLYLGYFSYFILTYINSKCSLLCAKLSIDLVPQRVNYDVMKSIMM